MRYEPIEAIKNFALKAIPAEAYKKCKESCMLVLAWMVPILGMIIKIWIKVREGRELLHSFFISPGQNWSDHIHFCNVISASYTF